MARLCAAALAVLAAVALAGGVGAAQALPRLHVTAFSIQSDRMRVAPGETFHVTIHLHVTERIGEPANLFLPDVTNCEIDGTERRTSAGPGGTDYREILTLTAKNPGRAQLSPARLLAVNAQTGIPSQFSSNALTIVVAGPGQRERAISGLLRTAGRLAIVVGGLACAVIVLAAIVRLRRARNARAAVAAPSAPAAEPPPRPPDRTAALRAAFAKLAAGRGPEDALAVRAELFALAGAPPGATLRDVMRLGSVQPAVGRALTLAEEAAFAEGARRAAAVDELLRIAAPLVAGLT